MDAPLEGKKIAPNNGTLVAFEEIPKQIERDEIDEEFGFESFYTTIDTKDEEKMESCFI